MNRTSFSAPDKSRVLLWDNPSDVLSHNDYLMAVFILHCVVKPVIIVVGVPTNVINCLVFWHQGLRDRMNVCLFALSLADLSLLLVSAAFSISYYIERIDPVTWDGLYTFLQAYLVGVGQGFRTASGCITMVIAMERCLCVVFPLKAAILIRTRTMAGVMVCIVCVTQLGFFTMPARIEVLRVANSTSKFVLVSSDWYRKNEFFINVFESVVMMSVIPIATFIVISLATAVTVVQLRAAMTWRRNTSSSGEEGQGQHSGLTKMLVVVSSIYILTTIPWVIFYLGSLAVDEFSLRGQYYNFYLTSYVIVYYFPYANSSLNFFVFINRSARFRKDALNLFGGSRKLRSAERQKSETLSKSMMSN